MDRNLYATRKENMSVNRLRRAYGMQAGEHECIMGGEFCRCARQRALPLRWTESFATALDREFCHCVGQRVLPLCWTENLPWRWTENVATVLDGVLWSEGCCNTNSAYCFFFSSCFLSFFFLFLFCALLLTD